MYLLDNIFLFLHPFLRYSLHPSVFDYFMLGDFGIHTRNVKIFTLLSQLVFYVIMYLIYWFFFFLTLRVLRLILCLARLRSHQDGAVVATHCRSSTEAPVLSSELKIHVL